MNICRKLAINFYKQVVVRRNLCHIRDRRFLSPTIRGTLFEAGRYWPEVLDRFYPRIILDIGAHTGEIAAQLSKLYKPDFIGLVEPLPHLAMQLEGRTFARKQKVFACALGSKAGRTRLNVIASEASSSILEITPGLDELYNRPMHVKSIIEVPVRTLDDVFSECEVDTIDLIKIDVQGYELEVLRGGGNTLSQTKVVVSEVSFFEHYKSQPMFEDIYMFLRSKDFKMRGTFEWFYDKNGLPLQCDAVFMNCKFFDDRSAK